MGRFALKENEQFLVADEFGDISGPADGLFCRDTRLLSRLSLTIGGRPPSLLQSGVSHDNVYFRAHLTNLPLPELGGAKTPEGVIHLERTRLLWAGRLHEQIALANYGTQSVRVPLEFAFAGDFADIFEVRGMQRAKRGDALAPEIGADRVRLAYRGLDDETRTCIVGFSAPPLRLSASEAAFTFELPPHARAELHVEIGGAEPATPSRARYRDAAARALLAMRRKRRRGATVEDRATPFAAWLGKARADLALLTDDLPTGPYPCAGIPWFSTMFGRDGIITALQMLWLDPMFARGVLGFLAAHQALEHSAFQDAAPGKILHEIRRGEMAALDEVPFRQYYGAVDSTPLFVMLAGAYAERTGDLAYIDGLWPALTRAMKWIEEDGDSNRDGFVDYARGRETGLANQGWKDSHDSVFHADGRAAEGPISLVEVQGYAYAAKLAMAKLARLRGDAAAAVRWRMRAKAMRAAVERAFWFEEDRYYAVALDGDGRACRVRTSNAGHLLYVRLPSARRAAMVIEQLTSTSFDDGWGIRTLARGQPRFNPMSYHNGSIWPHDTALCAAGIAHYGHRQAAARILSELLSTASQFDHRMPELYCGFQHRPGEPPVGYPVACLPQAWSSGAAFMLLQACLGISIAGSTGVVRIERPELPAEMSRLRLWGLAVGNARIDLAFERVGPRIAVTPIGPLPASVEVLVLV